MEEKMSWNDKMKDQIKANEKDNQSDRNVVVNDAVKSEGQRCCFSQQNSRRPNS